MTEHRSLTLIPQYPSFLREMIDAQVHELWGRPGFAIFLAGLPDVPGSLPRGPRG